MSSVKSLVLLKYEIITPDRTTWHLCETYPLEVRKNWAWRCALDVEHLAAGYKEAEECIAVAKKYRDGLVTLEELNITTASISSLAATAAYAAAAAYYAAITSTINYVNYSPVYTITAAHTAYAANNAAYSAAHAATAAITAKWVLYINGLIEELCIWEEKQ